MGRDRHGDSDGHYDGFAMRHGDIVDLAVHPEARGHGVGTALAAEVAADGRKVEAWSHGDHPAAARIAERFGIARERELMIMRRSLVEPLEQVVVPPGVTVRGFQPADEAALLEVNASAFAHHPEQGHMTHEDFRERSSESWFDPDGLLLAVPAEGSDGPRLLGFHWTKVHRDEDPPYGEVYVVAVNPKAAGRGSRHGAHRRRPRSTCRDQGLDSVLLYVDGDNDPAIAVYTNLGFEVERTEVQYRGTPVSPAQP